MTKVSQGFGHKANSSSSGSEIQEGEIKEPVESPKVQVLDDDEGECILSLYAALVSIGFLTVQSSAWCSG